MASSDYRDSRGENASRIRPPAVAGLFYPAEPDTLRRALAALLAEPAAGVGGCKALIAPHAGYVYSGTTAAAAYTELGAAATQVRRVVLLGPSHRVPFRGVALTRADAYATPLGLVPTDAGATERVRALPQVGVLDEAHGPEHSLEVHLPFLQAALGEFTLVPLVVGEAAPESVAEVIEVLWGGPETLVVVSTDLSHYLDYDTARRVDRETTRAIKALETTIRPEQACGSRPLNGLLLYARTHGLGVRTLKLTSSGDTAGPRDRVVGYGAYALA